MASPVRTLTVNFVGKTKDLDRAFRRVSKGSSLMSDRMARAASIGMGAFAGIGAAVVGATAVLKPMIEAASDVDESLSKNRVLFGDAAAAAERFAESSAEAFGMSRRDALEAVGVFGALAHAMGMPQAEGVDLSVTLTKLAADMASFGNVGVEETLTALQAGLRGEAEPLRRFGVLLDAATLKTKALEMGLVDNEKKALTPQQKAMAAYQVILEKTAVQQDDFTRTADGLANQQKILGATFDNISVQIGENLLPALTSIVTFLNEEFVPAFEDALDDPSVYNIAKGFGSVLHAGVAAGYIEGEVDAPLMLNIIEILTLGPDDIRRFIDIGWDIASGTHAGWDNYFESNPLNIVDPAVMADAGVEIDNMFAEIAENFGVDISDVINRGASGATLPDAAGTAASDAAVVADAIAEAAGLITNPEVSNILGGTPATSPGPGSQEDAMDAFRGEELPDLPPGPSKGGFSGGPTGGGKRTPEGPRGPSGDFLAPVAGFLASGGPPNTQITIIAPAVTGKEVWDAMGEAVKANGPMPPHWQQNAS
jgi:hypothetical protein